MIGAKGVAQSADGRQPRPNRFRLFHAARIEVASDATSL